MTRSIGVTPAHESASWFVNPHAMRGVLNQSALLVTGHEPPTGALPGTLVRGLPLHPVTPNRSSDGQPR